MKIISFILDILPFLGGIKMMIEAGFKKDLVGNELNGKLRKIHFFIGLITLIFDCFTLEGGGITRGLIKLLGEGFLKRLAETGAEKAAEKTLAKKVLQGTVRTIEKAEESRVGKYVVKKAEDKIRDKVKEAVTDVEDYRRNPEKRKELQEKYGQTERDKKEIRRRVIELQKHHKKVEEENKEEVSNTDLDYIRQAVETKATNSIFNRPRILQQKKSVRDTIIERQKKSK